MATAEGFIKRAELCLAKAGKATDRNTRVRLRETAANWVRMAEQFTANTKRAQEARAVASEKHNDIVRRSTNRLAEHYESESG